MKCSITIPQLRAGMLAAVILVLTGCQTYPLMATPNLYFTRETYDAEAIPEALQVPEAVVIYATDRAPATEPDAPGPYSGLRSPALAFGTCTVQLAPVADWAELVEISQTSERDPDHIPTCIAHNEVARFPAGGIAREEDTSLAFFYERRKEAERAATEQLHALLRDYTTKANSGEAYVFVHGYNTQFEEAVSVIAQLWHFMERNGIPIAYSWPAGRAGAIGYAYDRESGEFTVGHLKQFLRALAASPDITRVHLLAHSRGTDVVLTALRELHLEYRGTSENVSNELKLGQLVLAAPDLDFEIMQQRVAFEGVLALPERTTIYLSEKDKALGLSTLLFESIRRIGRLRPDDLKPEEIMILQQMQQLDLVDARKTEGDAYGHAYFYHDPAVSSDVILVLRDGRLPGAQHGRPLESRDNVFWNLPRDYPAFGSAQDIRP